MFENIINFFKKFSKESSKDSKDTAKERLHLVLMQDRANVSADFLELMKQEIIEVIKKYIDVDENLIDVKLTNKVNTDGTTGAPALYANIPIVSLKDDNKKLNIERQKPEAISEENKSAQEEVKIENKDIINEPQKESNEEVQKVEVLDQTIEENKSEINSVVENEQIENIQKQEQNLENLAETQENAKTVEEENKQTVDEQNNQQQWNETAKIENN